MGESGEVVQRRARRFVLLKNTAFFARPTKNTRKLKNGETPRTQRTSMRVK